MPTTSSSSDPCTAPLLLRPPPLTSLSSASSSCAYLFAAFYAFICFDFFTISQRLLHCLSPVPLPPVPVTPSRQCNLSISYTFRHTPSSALPHSSNAVATSVTRFSLFPFQFFRCVLWQLSACSRCSFFLPLCSSSSSSTCCCCAF